MSLINQCEELFLGEFYGLEYEQIEDYMKKNRDTILFLCKHKESLNKEIEEIIGKSIIKKVRESYYPRLLRNVNLDSLKNPEYFVYALQKNSFTFDELRKINLGNDNWKNAIMKKYQKPNILKHLREKFLNISEDSNQLNL